MMLNNYDIPAVIELSCFFVETVDDFCIYILSEMAERG